MKIQIIKPHFTYSGIVDLDNDAANYLIRMGVAVEVTKEKKEYVHEKEKVEIIVDKEKAETRAPAEKIVPSKKAKKIKK